MKQIIYYTTEDNECPYLDWYNSLDKSKRHNKKYKGIKMKIKKEILDRGITHEKHMQEVLKDCEYQQEYLRLNIEEYAKNGDYTLFFKSLKRVVKVRTTISRLAKDLEMNRSNLSNILQGKVKPSFDTTIKILRGLGAEIEVKFA